MPVLDVQRLLEATRQRSQQLRTRRRLLAGSVVVAVAAAIAIPIAALSAGSSRQAVIVSPGPSTPTTAAKSLIPPAPGPTTIVAVPDVVGQTYFPTASIAIASANLVSKYQLEHSATVSAGTVIVQSPAAGSTVSSDTTVSLGVSIGPADIPGAQPCRAANLKVVPGEPVSEDTGQRTTDWSLTNLANSCVLEGYPTVTALDSQGRVLGFSYSHSGDQMTTAAAPQPVYLPKGSSAWIRLNKYRCDIQTQDTAASLRLNLPSGGGTLSLSAAFSYCSEAPSLTIAVSPFEPVEMLLSSIPNTSIGPLAVQLTASPVVASPGHDLTYTITVTNLGTTPLNGVSARLPLPAYVGWVSWSPNCQGQGPTFTCSFGGDSTSPPPGPQAQLQSGQSQSASITTTVDTSPTVQSFSATVTASATAPSGQVTATVTTATVTNTRAKS